MTKPSSRPRITMAERLRIFRAKSKSEQSTATCSTSPSFTPLPGKCTGPESENQEQTQNNHPNISNGQSSTSPLASSILTELRIPPAPAASSSSSSSASSLSARRQNRDNTHFYTPGTHNKRRSSAGGSSSSYRYNRGHRQQSTQEQEQEQQLPPPPQSPQVSARTHQDCLTELHGLRSLLDAANEGRAEAEQAAAAAEARAAHAEAQVQSCWGEVQAQHFLNSVQAQELEQLQVRISRDRMDKNESDSERKEKHKAALRRVKDEKVTFEQRANAMMEQMQQQMNCIQVAAMARIDALEGELLEQKHKESDVCTQLQQKQAECVALNRHLETLETVACLEQRRDRDKRSSGDSVKSYSSSASGSGSDTDEAEP